MKTLDKMQGNNDEGWQKWEPAGEMDDYTQRESDILAPFFTNLDRPVYVPVIFSPEVIGALCSRTSRAEGDLRRIFLEEYLRPFLEPQREAGEDDDRWQEKQACGRHLKAFIDFLKKHSIYDIFSNPRARSFYHKWLAQYGDDSIAQMAGTHLVYTGLSQVAIKHIEDQRIGLAPLEKSTRYVDYSGKIKGQYRYYTDPKLRELGLEEEYRAAMDGLFDTYSSLKPRLAGWLEKGFPGEKKSVIEKKAFDTLRGLLPASTLSQLALFGNGQAFEYMIARSARHRLGELRWAAEAAYAELSKVVPSFLRRLKDRNSIQTAQAYQEYLAGRNQRLAPAARRYLASVQPSRPAGGSGPSVSLVEYDREGEAKAVAAMLYSASGNRAAWEEMLAAVKKLKEGQRREIIDRYLEGRTQRWQKVGRAFENVYVRFEILMNIGAWRDLHRHRMLTQQRQQFCLQHGYDVPPEIEAAGLGGQFRAAVERAEAVHEKIADSDRELAQYAVTLAHRLRFMQWQNLRECFWEMELRTIPEGHPDYRRVEQEKFRLLEQVYPAIACHLRVNMGEYDFARRGQEEKIQAKLGELADTRV